MRHSREQIIRTIKELFEESRESPGVPYDDNKMIWNLVSRPRGRESIHNTFKGKWRLSNFLKKLEIHFMICFSLNDWESLKSSDQVADRVIYLLETPRSSLQSIQNILKQRPPDMLALLIGVLSLPLVVIAVKILGYVGLICLLLPAALIVITFQIDRRSKKFYRKIAGAIRTNDSGQPQQTNG